MTRVYVIGGGPSGMMAAISCKMHHPQTEVFLVERNNKLGVKLQLSGGGRCNVCANLSNDELVQRALKNGRFLYSALEQFNTKDIIRFFEEAGCPLVEEDHERMFPKSNDAKSILQVLVSKLASLQVQVLYNAYVSEINTEQKQIVLNHKKHSYDHIILACGGKSYYETGSDGTGYQLAEMFGHTIQSLYPAEVPLVSNDPWVQSKALQGITCKDITCKVLKKDKVIFKVNQNIIFTHFGISGPAALQVSTPVTELLKHQKTVTLAIDFLPFVDSTQLSIEIKKYGVNKTLLKYGLAKRLIDYLVAQNSQDVLKLVKNFTIQVYDTRGFRVAFVTGGGVSINEINPRTMISKKDGSLSFCGEMIDIHGFTGGINMTIAFVSGYVAGKNCL